MALRVTGAERRFNRVQRDLSRHRQVKSALVVGINTWAGHAPGIVFNNGMDPNAGSSYKRKYGIDVKFVLLEDPAAKLAAFRSGQVDIMWNTVDNWAREASILAEQNQNAKSIIMQDWSRGGDGIASLASIKSIEDLKGHKISCTQFTPSHFLLLYLLSQSGLSPADRAAVEKDIIFTTDAPAAAAAFKAKQVDAAVTWEPDLSGAVTARGAEAHVLVSTQAATNIIADTLCARQDALISPETVRDFVHGWLDGIEMSQNDPNPSYEIVAKALNTRHRHFLRHVVGIELTPYAITLSSTADRSKGSLRDLFDTAFVIWRKRAGNDDCRCEGLVRYSSLQANSSQLSRAEVEELSRGKGASDRTSRFCHQQISDSVHARLGRDHAGLVPLARQVG